MSAPTPYDTARATIPAALGQDDDFIWFMMPDWVAEAEAAAQEYWNAWRRSGDRFDREFYQAADSRAWVLGRLYEAMADMVEERV